MKEELIKYVMERANNCYVDDFPISEIETWIREFFASQPVILMVDGKECISGHSNVKLSEKK